MANERLPKTEYAAEYPWNQVTVSRSGHEFHVDDTPGKERLRTAHKSGTFFEISPDGKKVELVVGHEYHYVKGGLTLTIDNNSDVHISGNIKLIIQGDAYAEVAGDMTTVVAGDMTSAVIGNSTQMVGGDATTKVDGNISAKVDGNLNAEVGGDMEASIAGTGAISTEGRMKLQAAGFDIKGDVELQGKITASDDVLAQGVSLTKHKHVGVQPGGGQTGIPSI